MADEPPGELPTWARRSRMADVAARAGVSLVTVSRVLRAPELVRAPTRARIEAAIAELGYVPNLVAGSLAAQRTRLVAAIVPTLAYSFFAATVQGLADALHRAGYQLLLGHTNYDVAAEEDLATAVLGRLPDGLVLIGSRHSPRTRALLQNAGLPVVETWELAEQPVDMVAGFSNEAAGRAMAGALVDWGYRRVGFVGAPAGAELRSDQRRQGWRAAVVAAGLVPGPEIDIAETNDFEAGGHALARLVERDPMVDALFCANDSLAAGAIAECLRRGWPVPGRIAVAGFGDFDVAAAIYPSLTTVRVPGYAMGAEAARLVLDRLAHKPIERRVIDLGFEIIRRESA